MTEQQLRKDAEAFAKKQMGYKISDAQDFLEEQYHTVDYLLALLLGKDPEKCICDSPSVHGTSEGVNVCINCEKPV